ncbi:diguanylate cyclase (GGDEF)-like protein/PAS domain S-box-containing protein [Cytobacillus eiseniae]|uniref:Diguanylate cyclase (GGDEF)-like protein/PAS domain S-box-containing protein n=1 Tax=Cytobacillus eiseniae TaxID=762947 RepID=A0ABS4RFH9_9BACI|nr:EAL domain-containing protein [Cytobacillus eiseniae]MBP2241125.1 diguanylate cyclase (GGDEF)-like protein/PAS domain S-box-containing protein [Cytobacillus eiseniae]
MAKTITCSYENSDQLYDFIHENDLGEYPNLLVQVYSSSTNRTFLIQLQSDIKNELPYATIIGCTSSGEIIEGRMAENKVIVSFTHFEKTELKSLLLHQSTYQDSFELGKAIAGTLLTFDTKAIILYSAGTQVDAQSVLDGIHQSNQGFVIAGGLANGINDEPSVFTGEEITSSGIVAVALQSDQLVAEVFSHSKWTDISRPFHITKAKDTIIYSIENKKPIQILTKYLGKAFVDRLPISGFEFPFMIDEKERKVPVFIKSILKNGAIEVNRKISEHQEMTLAFSDIEGEMKSSLSNLKYIEKKQIETIFIFSGMARKQFTHAFTVNKLEMLQNITATNGFFTNGELIGAPKEKPVLLDHSMTYLGLSENTSQKRLDQKQRFKYTRTTSMKTLSSFIQLMQSAQLDLQLLNENLKVSEQYHQSLFNTNSDIILSIDIKGRIKNTNPAFEKVLGYNSHIMIGKSALNLIQSEDVPRVRMYFNKALKGKEQFLNVMIQPKHGEANLHQIKLIPILMNEECLGVYVVCRNISEQKRIEEKITELSYYDHDTGLPNRIKLTEQLENMLAKAKKKKRILAVLSIDIDRFKIINDSLGHFAGDMVLKELAYRIEKVLPSGAYLGRFGGDKFTVIVSKEVMVEEVLKICKLILKEISKPIDYKGRDFFVTASIGVSFYPEDGMDEHELLKNADIATNRSKNHGGNRITFFSNEMNEHAVSRFELESYLRKALQKQEFYLMYQPLIDLETGGIFGSEALIRWNHPKLGLVSPADFIPLAEETGLIEEIGNWVLRTACIQNKKWQLQGHRNLSVSVNVSAYQFQQPGFIKEVKKALNESKLDPCYLTLELTESTMLDNIGYSIQTMELLQKLGVKVSIDDFGTGYSSLSYLKNLPINTLKIDRSFINNLRLNTSDIAIVKAIITMGHGLAVKVLAEGVETKEQIELLKELKCHYAQGFYIHRPLQIADFEKGLEKPTTLLN